MTADPLIPPRNQTPDERDDMLRFHGYSARCSYWESLTDQDIWGGTRPPLPPIYRPAPVEEPAP